MTFALLAGNMHFVSTINLRGKKLILPTFFPDATRGFIRGVSTQDLENIGIPGLVTNTFHLMSMPGTRIINNLGGAKQFMRWGGFLITDSGGFQVMSLIHKNPKLGKLTDRGVTFSMDSLGKKKEYDFTPEHCIEEQFRLNADIMICLDDCPSHTASKEEIIQSIERTVSWAKRCKIEFEKQCNKRKLTEKDRPHLFAVVQGGKYPELRTMCGERLSEIGFDGYGFGGFPVSDDGRFLKEELQAVVDSTPGDKPKYGLGVGTPSGIVESVRMGYTIFDCVLPTRDARHKRLYVFKEDPKISSLNGDFWSYISISKEKYISDPRPISEFCDCYTCRTYSRAFLYHLFKVGDSLAGRLATIHNLRMYQQLMERLQELEV